MLYCMKRRAMIRSYTFVFHAFISANIIPSSNHSCRKTYRLACAYLEKRFHGGCLSSTIHGVMVMHWRCMWKCSMLLVVAVAGLRTRQENRVFSGENTDYVMRIRVRRFQYTCGAYCSDTTSHRAGCAAPLSASSLTHSCTSGSFECEDELPLLSADRHDGQAIAAPEQWQAG